MGYTTYFSGSVEINPPLNEHEISFLTDFNQTRRMHRKKGPLFVKGTGPYGQGHDSDVLDHNGSDPDQPGLWCQWVPSDDGHELMWDEGEKFYSSLEWMEYIVNNLLSPAARPYIDAHLKEDERLKHFTCDHVVNGAIYADGEDSDDHWRLVVENNVVRGEDGFIAYGPQPDQGPAPEEVAAAIKSIGGGKLKVKVWSLTTDADEIVTQVFGTEEECYASLRANFAEDFLGDDGALIDELTERRGVVLYIEDHDVEVRI